MERHLAFPAYLRAHEAVRDAYAALKRDAYARHPADIEAYMAAKDAWIQRTQAVAIRWYREQTPTG